MEIPSDSVKGADMGAKGRRKGCVVDEGALERLAETLAREGRAQGTIECYLRAARLFAQWMGGAPVTEESASKWRDEALSKGYAPTSVNAMLAGVNKLLRVMGCEEYRARALRIQRRSFRDESRELSEREYRRLVFAARLRGKSRAALAMEAICSTGIRVSELCFLTVEAAMKGRAIVSLKGKVRTVLIPRSLSRKLLDHARRLGVASGPVLVGRGGKPLSRKSIWAEMKALAEVAGVAASKAFPHNLRHLFARLYYESCRDVVRLADILGHSSIETTRIYLVTTGEEQARAIESLGLVG